MRGAIFAALLLAGVGPVGDAHADDVDNLAGRVVEIEARVRELETELRPPREPPAPEQAERRLIDAQVLYELKNYEAASIVLLDVVQKYGQTPVYPEAMFFLADSLYLKRDFLSSRRYFDKVVEIGPVTKRYQESLQRLIELSLHTGDYTPVDGYIAKLSELRGTTQLPSVPYVKGKYYYFRKRYDDSLSALKEITPGHKYWFHSQYFIAAVHVAQARVVDAIGSFDAILKAEPKNDSERRVAELAHLGLGRIYYDRGQFTNATAEYAKISAKSELFADALHELAWVSIKAKEYKKAFRALDVLLTAKPDDPQIPEFKLLMGNLHLREAEYMNAQERFTQTREEFEPIKKQLDEILVAHGDPQRHFQELIGKNLGRFDVASILPPIAVKWVRADPQVTKLTSVVNDVGDLKKSLDESEEIVRKLERAVTGPARVNIFPELKKARTRALEAESEIEEIHKRLIERERDLLAPVAGSERTELEALHARRKQIEAQLGTMPRSADSYEERLKKAKSQFDALDKQAAEINVLIASYAAQRVAIDKFYKDTLREQKIDPAQFERELAEVRGVEEELRKQYDALRREIDDATSSVGIDDSQMQMEAGLRAQLSDVMQKEHDLGASVRGRLSGSDRTKADQIDSVLTRAKGAGQTLAGFNKRLEGLVDEKLKDIKISIYEEKANVELYRRAIGGQEGEMLGVGGGIAAESFKGIADRFYQIVVRSDVGVIDVAWALKRDRTDEDQKLVREQKRELKMLDDEFREVLKE